MIGVRQSAAGLWVHGRTLPWDRIPQMQGSCAAMGGKLVFGPIGSGPMYGFWCCGGWGCTDFWRPDQAGFGALPPGAQPLGQSPIPFGDTITKLLRELNSVPCIPSKGWIQIIDKALAFASDQTPYAFSFYRLAPGNTVAAGRNEMARAKASLTWWRNRLATEGDVAYCKGYNLVGGKKVDTQDRWLLTQTVMQPYQVASGITGAEAVLGPAAMDLFQDVITAAPLWRKDYEKERKELLPWWLNTDYLIPIGIAAVAFGVFFRVKGPSPIVRTPVESDDATASSVALPKAAPAPLPPTHRLSPSSSAAPPTSAPPRSTTRMSGVPRSSASLSPMSPLSGTRKAETSVTRAPGAPASRTFASRTSASRRAPEALAARDWFEYKRQLRSGEPRDGRRGRHRYSRSREGI